MRISDAIGAIALSLLVGTVTLSGSGQVHALDQKTVQAPEKRSPWAVFRFGFSAYKNGRKDEALEAYRYAAENGQIGARWKLARMYAEGDGVERDDYEAFKFFREIAQQEVEPGSPDERYVSDALAALGNYVKQGIPGSPVSANPAAAQELYWRAANYGSPAAQFEVGKMFLNGDGVQASLQQAGRWLQLAAAKGHRGAQATLGNLLFRSGQEVRGLAMMTAALHGASSVDRAWIRSMQEEAFGLSSEADRRTAMVLAEDMLAGTQ